MAYTFSDLISMAGQINAIVTSQIQGAITSKNPNAETLLQQGITWGTGTDLQYYPAAINAIDKNTAEIPSGTKFAYSVWTAIPNEVAEYTQLSTLTDCSNLFTNCAFLTQVGTSIDPFLLGGKLSIERIFQGCTNLNSVYLKGPQEWLNGSRAFQGCSNLNTVSFASQPLNPTNLESMFEGCSSLTSIVPIQLTNVQGVDCDAMYKNSGLIQDIPSTFLGEGTHVFSADEMFQDCAIPSVGNMNLRECSSCRAMFQITSYTSGRAQLLTVGNLQTDACVNMNYMFAGQVQLTSVQSIDMGSCITADNMFQNCNNLNTLVIKNLGGSSTMTKLDLSDLTNWTIGLEETVNKAVDRSANGFTLKLSSTTKSALSEDQKNTLTSKGYTLI